ncbi:MAG: GHKL domain-containing protein [Chloroflexia bacterium]|nr:GHKL domain-containing protein [Chloroflexia bacterium]
MLHTILRNLISNAIKFTPEHGQITVNAESDKSGIQVCVADTGIGIKAIDLENLFRIDVNSVRKGTNKEEGTGLGLLICDEFIKSHGGKIWVESEERKGSKFFFTVPHKG